MYVTLAHGFDTSMVTNLPMIFCKSTLLEQNIWFLIQILLKFVLMIAINNKPASAQMTTWHWKGNLIWTSDGLVYLCTYAPLGLNVLHDDLETTIKTPCIWTQLAGIFRAQIPISKFGVLRELCNRRQINVVVDLHAHISHIHLFDGYEGWTYAMWQHERLVILYFESLHF